MMKLRLEFKASQSNLMNHDPSPSLDMCSGELLCEEQHLATQATLQQDKLPNNIVAYPVRVKRKGKDMGKVQCYSCKAYEHVTTHYVKSIVITTKSKDILLEISLSILESLGRCLSSYSWFFIFRFW